MQGILRFKNIYKYIYTLINGKAKQTHIGWISGAQLLIVPRAGVDMGPPGQPTPHIHANPGCLDGRAASIPDPEGAERGVWQASWQGIFLAATLSRLIDFSQIASFFMIWHFPMEKCFQKISG